MLTTKETFQPIAFLNSDSGDVAVMLGVPAGFQQVPVQDHSTAKGLLDLKNEWKKPSTGPVTVRLFSSKLQDELAVGDIAEIESVVCGEQVVLRSENPNRPEFEAQMLSTSKQNGHSFNCRSKIIKDGSFVYKLEARADARCDRETGELCSQIASSLTLAGDPSRELAEALQTHTPGNGLVEFQCPVSWKPEVTSGKNGQFSLSLHRNFPEGAETIGVDVFPVIGFSVESCFQEYVTLLGELGCHVGGAAILPTKPVQDFEKAFVCCPTVFREGNPMATGATVCQAGMLAARVWSLGAAREQLPNWAITSRAVKIILRSLRVVSNYNGQSTRLGWSN